MTFEELIDTLKTLDAENQLLDFTNREVKFKESIYTATLDFKRKMQVREIDSFLKVLATSDYFYEFEFKYDESRIKLVHCQAPNKLSNITKDFLEASYKEIVKFLHVFYRIKEIEDNKHLLRMIEQL